jgi:outer membrane murein-binding lipoprotein Lpp
MSDYQGTERLGLYIMVIVILITTCSVENKVDRMASKIYRIKSKVDRIESKIDYLKTQIPPNTNMSTFEKYKHRIEQP